MNLSTQPQLQLARFAFDPPIPLNTGEPLFFRFIVNSDTAGVVLAGMAPTIGSSTEDYFLVNTTGGCDPVPPAPGSPVSGVFHASITCGGAQPLGACCDPYLTQCAGGADDGKRCKSDAECAAPGTCGAVCRQTALINCPFPSGGQDLDPKWKEGAACSPEPYPNTPCGISSCCHLTFNLITSDPRDLREACVNMTKSECDAVPPLKKCAGGSSNGKSCEVAQDCPSGACEPAARLWQLGSYCSLGAQTCPRNACLARAGSCYSTHNTPGCSDPFCCTKVCTNFGAVGAYCCDIEWDQGCVDLAQVDPSDGGCANPPGNNECAPNVQRGIDGATTIPVPGSVPTDNRKATTSANEPGFCCHGGVGTCVGDPFNGEGCVEQVECSPGFCTSMTPSPGKQGVGTVWFKFVQPNGFTSARINTCTSNSPALDSLVQAFKVGDNTTPDSACRSLSVIGCNDDTPGCSSSGRNSDLCLQNLVPGETYYIALAAKTKSTRGQYRVAVSAGCNPSSGVLPNDYCPAASTITDGETPFFINVNVCIGGSKAGQVCTVPADCPNGGNCTEDRKQATIDCPAESCIAGGLNDVWYNYTATCTGTARFDTCGTDPAPDTNLAVYADCTKCPPVSDEPVCNGDCFLQGCGLGSCVNVDVQQGQCYKVRLSDNQGFPVSGKLTVTCLGNDCQPNGIPDDVDIANCPPNDPDCQDCNGNLKPDECDIRDGLDTDCNLNGVPDFCELATRDCQPNGIPDDCDITSGTSLDVSPADGIPDECQNDCSTDPATSVPP
ncbi:MAG: hypothetical protein Q7R41_12865, partial [Phycisphaerales bacterium]|nr:hypothetical protein [Phycisphaerales bacterium]